MTIQFDELARLTMARDFNESAFKYNGVPIGDMTIHEISCSFARRYISSFHYSKTMPDSTKYIYAGYLGDRLCGIVCYGMGCGKNQYTALIPSIQNGTYVELTRLWCADDMPKNTESRLISMSLKALPKEVKLVVSFADESEGHCGIIYQATNWYYCGQSAGGKMLLTKDGIKKHTRLLGIYRMRHPELKNYTSNQLMDLLGYTYIESGKKYRYVYLRGSKTERKIMYKQIRDKILPYPKADKKQGYSEGEIIREYLQEYTQTEGT